MPGRKYSAGNSYRHGFNGKEKDKDIYGAENAYDFGARVYDSRIGKWLSVDPLQQKYTDLSPYQYCANSPISAKDPDGRLIIFISGLWGWPNSSSVGNGASPEYWGRSWVERVQNQINDHADPRYFDGSLGGTSSLNKNLTISQRIKAGEKTGYNNASSILGQLNDGETIKIVTNSMGTAFARGFTKGILKYQAEENAIRRSFNADIDSKILVLTKERIDAAKDLDSKVMNPSNKSINQKIDNLNAQIVELESSKKKMLDVRFEQETDLSSHQIDYPNGDVENNYYMTCKPEDMMAEKLIGVNQQDITRAKFLGTMSVHHSSGAKPEQFIRSNTPDPKPKKKNE